MKHRGGIGSDIYIRQLFYIIQQRKMKKIFSLSNSAQPAPLEFRFFYAAGGQAEDLAADHPAAAPDPGGGSRC